MPRDWTTPVALSKRVARFYASIDFDVHSIPPSWDLEITFVKSGREQPDLDAQRVLAFLLCWCQPGGERRTRFSGEALNVSYRILKVRFGLTEKAVVAVLKRLEDNGLIRRHSGSRGRGRGAFLYVAPVMDRVEAITYAVRMDPATGKLQVPPLGAPVSGGPYYVDTPRRFELDSTGFTSRNGWQDGRSLVILAREESEDRGDRPVRGSGPVNPPVAIAPSLPVTGTGRPAPTNEGQPTDDPEANGSYAVEQDVEFEAPSEERHPESSETSRGSKGSRHSGPASSRPAGTNASAPEDGERRARRMIMALRGRLRRDLSDIPTDNHTARRAVARRAWHTAGRLQPRDAITRAVQNAWERLERRDHDPAGALVDLAVLACGRIAGSTEDRAARCVDLLTAVCREDVGADLLCHPIELGGLQTALRAAFLHRLDRDSAPKRLAAVCAAPDDSSKLFAFANELVRAYSRPSVPVHAPLFAGAMAAVVRDHEEPTALDLLGACHREARHMGYTPLPEGSHVLIGTRIEDEVGVGSFRQDESVVRLGQTPSWYADDHAGLDATHDIWAYGDEDSVEVYARAVDNLLDAQGREGLVTIDGSVIDAAHATVRQPEADRLDWLAVKATPSRLRPKPRDDG